MKVTKGNRGYIAKKKKAELMRTLISFAMVLAVFLTGYVTTKTKSNLLTVAAVLGALPACKFAVGFLTRLPFASLKEELYERLEKASVDLQPSYELLFTTRDKIYPVDCIVVKGREVCGYSSKKTDMKLLEQHLQKALAAEGLSNRNVKIFLELSRFAERLKELRSKTEETNKEQEDKVRQLLFQLSL